MTFFRFSISQVFKSWIGGYLVGRFGFEFLFHKKKSEGRGWLTVPFVGNPFFSIGVWFFFDRNRSRNYANRYSCSFYEVYFLIDRKKTWWMFMVWKVGGKSSWHRDSKVPCYTGILWDMWVTTIRGLSFFNEWPGTERIWDILVIQPHTSTVMQCLENISETTEKNSVNFFGMQKESSPLSVNGDEKWVNNNWGVKLKLNQPCWFIELSLILQG